MKRECLNSGSDEMTRGSGNVRITHNGLAATVRAVNGWHCPACGEIEFNVGEGERYADALAALLMGAQERNAIRLARTRKKLNLTQQQAAKLTGGGKTAFSRYERGQANPMPAVINLFRLLEPSPTQEGERDAVVGGCRMWQVACGFAVKHRNAVDSRSRMQRNP